MTVWSLLPCIKEAPEGLETIGDLYSGSQSQIYNQSLEGVIGRDGHSLSISSVSHLLLECAKLALGSAVDTFTVP